MPEGDDPQQGGWLKDKSCRIWQAVSTVLPSSPDNPDKAESGRVMAAIRQMVKFNIAKLEAAANG